MATKSQLVMRTGPNPGKTFSLNKPEMYIGRDISNDIVINDAEVSRKHVRFSAQGDRYMIEDLGSTNGTFINGQRISGPHVLSAGESIQMGENVVLVYEATAFDPDSTAVMSPHEAAGLSTEEPAMPPKPEPAPSMTMADEPALSSVPAPAPPPQPMWEPAPEPEPQPMWDPAPAPAPPPPPMPEPMMAPRSQEPSMTYTGESGPGRSASMVPAEPEKKSNRRTLIAGCGCLAILLCIVVVGGLWWIDSNSLWCTYLPFTC